MKVSLDYLVYPVELIIVFCNRNKGAFYQLLIRWLILLSHENFPSTLISSSTFIKTFDFKKDFPKRNACDKILLNLFSYLS